MAETITVRFGKKDFYHISAVVRRPEVRSGSKRLQSVLFITLARTAIFLQLEKIAPADMADYSNVAPPSSNAGGGMNDAFKDALQRARQVSTLKASESISYLQAFRLKWTRNVTSSLADVLTWGLDALQQRGFSCVHFFVYFIYFLLFNFKA